jgi:predicted DNA-binding transcriptional regulator AlpA
MLMTVKEACEYLQVARSTFDVWRARDDAPRLMKLPSGAIRIRGQWLDEWIEERAERGATA